MPSVDPSIIRKIKIVEALARDSGGDPIPDLVLRRYQLSEECELQYTDGSLGAEAAFDARCDATADACAELDSKIAGIVATSRAGLMAQIHLLAGDENDSLCVDGAVADRLAASIATGIRVLMNMRDFAGDRTPCGTDAGLIAAEQRIAAIVSGSEEGDQEEVERLEDYIDGTAPQSLAGAAVKLRRLADPNQLLCNADYDRDLDYASAQQVRDFVERLIGSADVAKFRAAEAEIPRLTGSPGLRPPMRSCSRSISGTMRPPTLSN
jgi:hypothetical protein